MTAEPVASSPLDLRGLSAVQLLQGLAESAVVFDGESGVVLLLNPAAERLFGRSAADVLGQPCEALLPGLSGAASSAEGGALLGTPIALPLQAQYPDGGVSVVVTLSAIDRERDAPALLALVRAADRPRHDDTARLAEALANAERRYRALTDSL